MVVRSGTQPIAHPVCGQAITAHQLRQRRARAVEHTDQDVLCSDTGVVHFAGFFLREDDRHLGRFLELFKHGCSLPRPVVFLMHCLTAHFERLGDRLPAPALIARIGHVDRFQPFT